MAEKLIQTALSSSKRASLTPMEEARIAALSRQIAILLIEATKVITGTSPTEVLEVTPPESTNGSPTATDEKAVVNVVVEPLPIVEQLVVESLPVALVDLPSTVELHMGEESLPARLPIINPWEIRQRQQQEEQARVQALTAEKAAEAQRLVDEQVQMEANYQAIVTKATELSGMRLTFKEHHKYDKIQFMQAFVALHKEECVAAKTVGDLVELFHKYQLPRFLNQFEFLGILSHREYKWCVLTLVNYKQDRFNAPLVWAPFMKTPGPYLPHYRWRAIQHDAKNWNCACAGCMSTTD